MSDPDMGNYYEESSGRVRGGHRLAVMLSGCKVASVDDLDSGYFTLVTEAGARLHVAAEHGYSLELTWDPAPDRETS